MKRIVVPTDFSIYAEQALQYAVFIARQSQAEIILIHVCDLLDDNFTRLKKIIREYNDAKTLELTNSLNRLKESVESDGVVIKTKLHHGRIVSSILAAAKENKADLIIMGTLGTTGLKTLFFGTKAAAVINESKIPVIAIPFNYKNPALKEILIAINDSKHSPGVFDPVFELKKLSNARIKAIVFTEENDDTSDKTQQSKNVEPLKKKIEKQFAGNDIEIVHLYGADFHDSIQQYAEEHKTDLLVMITQRRTFMQNLFKISMTRQMSYHINIPLLTLKGGDS